MGKCVLEEGLRTERMKQELKHYIRVFCAYQQNNWKDLLAHAELAINNHSPASTKVSPFFEVMAIILNQLK